MKRSYTMTWGAQLLNRGVRFRLWAPAARTVSLVLLLNDGERITPMKRLDDGWFERTDDDAQAGARYLYEIDGDIRVADPASRFQPDGPEMPSQVIDASTFDWPERAFVPVPYHEAIVYELHVGTFTPEGTYAAAAQRLDHLVDLGVTAIELMPLSEAPGTRNWGYDGVLHYAPSHRYGTPDDLKRFIVAAHERGLAVLLDVVYNHFGPQGNYLHRYAPQFFSGQLKTPWGAGIDYASPGNDAVRRYAIDNACYWLSEYAFDGLRLDATPMIFDDRP
jgi:maltooligosyltrehalose trehalohydrolase